MCCLARAQGEIRIWVSYTVLPGAKEFVGKMSAKVERKTYKKVLCFGRVKPSLKDTNSLYRLVSPNSN